MNSLPALLTFNPHQTWVLSCFGQVGQMTPGIVCSTGGRTADLVEMEALVKTNPNGKKPRQVCTV